MFLGWEGDRKPGACKVMAGHFVGAVLLLKWQLCRKIILIFLSN